MIELLLPATSVAGCVQCTVRGARRRLQVNAGNVPLAWAIVASPGYCFVAGNSTAALRLGAGEPVFVADLPLG